MMKDVENVALEVPRIMYIREQDIEGIRYIPIPAIGICIIIVYSVWILSCLLVYFVFALNLIFLLCSQITGP